MLSILDFIDSVSLYFIICCIDSFRLGSIILVLHKILSLVDYKVSAHRIFYHLFHSVVIDYLII
uniref:Uncharacterized protein n=1 Tax=Octopus bimaculoides TaxID=37653 RepID=A0A0L8GGQ9_OCTBM